MKGSGFTVSDRFKRGPWRRWRVEVEESWRRTLSKLLCISSTTCGPLDARARSKRNSPAPGEIPAQMK